MIIPETFRSVSEQLTLFGISCLLGIGIGICWDICRAVRIIFPYNSVLVALEDILFACGYAIFLSAFVSAAARGEFRFYYVIGNLLGFALYLATVGSAVVRTIRKLFTLINGAFNVIIRPFKSLYAFLCKKYGAKFVRSSKSFVNSLKNVKNLLRKPISLLYNNKENKNRKT